jgi:polyphosphate glucokinase
MDVLIIDVGGSSVKLWHTAHEEHRKFESGKQLTPDAMVRQTVEVAEGWTWEAVALGLPCRVSGGRPVDDPVNLGGGWVGFNFAAAFGVPVRIMNDACLQALGSYDGGRMLFLGLGTGVGSAFIADSVVLMLDVGRLAIEGELVSVLLNDDNLKSATPRNRWKAIKTVIPQLKAMLMADYVVLGGGGVSALERLPDACRKGHNRTVVEGGRRLWTELPDPAEKTDEKLWIIR